MSRDEFVLLVADVVHITERAILLSCDGEEFWVPKSQVEDPDNLEPGEEDAEIRVKKWVLDERGL